MDLVQRMQEWQTARLAHGLVTYAQKAAARYNNAAAERRIKADLEESIRGKGSDKDKAAYALLNELEQTLPKSVVDKLRTAYRQDTLSSVYEAEFEEAEKKIFLEKHSQLMEVERLETRHFSPSTTIEEVIASLDYAIARKELRVQPYLRKVEKKILQTKDRVDHPLVKKAKEVALTHLRTAYMQSPDLFSSYRGISDMFDADVRGVSP